MSYVPKDILKGNLDPTLAFYTTDQPFTVTQLIIECKTMFQAYAKTFRIVNEDPTNKLTYRQGSTAARLKSVPPSSEVVVTGWESYIEVNPNAGTGAGFVELDLVNLKDALK